MLLDIDVLKAMAAAGATAEMIIAAVERAQNSAADALSEKRRKDRERKRRSRDVTRIPRDDADSTHAVADQATSSTTDCVPSEMSRGHDQKEKSPPIPPSKEKIDRDRRARETISPEALSLSNDFLAAIGVDPQNPELHGMAGAPYAAAVWIARGYDRGMVLATAADVAARHGSNKPLNYYGKCFETAHKARAAPAPEREFPLLRTIEGNHETDRRTDWQRRRDAARDAVDEFKAALRDAASVGSG